MGIETLKPLTTTGIGSLPHRAPEEALEQSFRVDIPYLPELPMMDPREFMLVHATEGIPGIIFDEDGMVTLDLDAWKKGRGAYDDKLHTALQGSDARPFLPTPQYSAALEPFLSKLRSTKASTVASSVAGAGMAKVQIAGPMTIQWSLLTTHGEIPPAPALTHVSRTVLARSLALADAVKAAGREPLLFFDEPGLYAFSRQQPRHLMMMQELRINLMALKKRGVTVGLHCCSDADWGSLMGLGLDVLAIDVKLSLRSLLRAADTLVTFVSMGGRLALGVIPTDRAHAEEQGETGDEYASVADLFARFNEHLATLEQYFPTRASILEHMLGRSLLTPACGLAFKPIAEAESIVTQLAEFKRMYAETRA